MAIIKRIQNNSAGSFQTLSFTLLATLLVTACSSSSDPAQPLNDAVPVDPDNDDRPGLAIEGLNGVPANQVTSPWLANMSFFRLDSETPVGGDAYIELLQYGNSFEASNHIDFYTPELDTCEIRDLSTDGGGNNEGGNRPDMLNGGQTLTLNTPSGTWFELESNTDSVGVYETIKGLPGAFPAGLTLSIPGADFPTVAAYPLMEPTPPVRLLPTSEVLTMAEVTAPFTWIPGDSVPGGFFEIVAIAYNSAGNFVGFPALCAVVDDGSFSMPQSVIDEFATTDLTIRVRFQRVINRVDVIDGIVFHQKSTVGE